MFSMEFHKVISQNNDAGRGGVTYSPRIDFPVLAA